MRIAMCQMKMCESIAQNEEKSIEFFEMAVMQGAELILFPELQLCPFFPQYEKKDVSKYLMSRNSSFVKKIQELCKKHSVMAAPNIFLSENEQYYDATLLIGFEGQILGVQKMVHIAQAENFYEQDYYTPSDDGFQVFDTPYGKIGIVVCFDRHYPESIRKESVEGAELILIPTANTKDEPLEMFEWEVRVQAFQNCVPIVMCNRVGKEDAMDFAGESLAVDGNGSVIVKADDTEQIIYADIDIADTKTIRKSKPYLKLRREELYGYGGLQNNVR